MKYIFFLLLSVFISNAQITKEQLDLMPWPKNIDITNGTFALSKNFKVNITGNPDARLFSAATRFLRRLDGRTGLFFELGFVTKINEVPEAQFQINCIRSGIIGINENESYHLSIDSTKIVINAETDLGAMHALETVLQLLQNDSKSFYFPSVNIADSPRFT
ncbi:MAG: glycoside hydrolase family 20 zincin-like fold domain-containing protein, partial [Flavobacterium sp.]